jgi:hypothetical protein
MVLTKQVEIGDGKTVTVRELTVGEIRTWLAEAEAKSAEGIDLIGALLMGEVALDDLARMTDITVAEMDGLSQSALNTILEAARTLNPNFFGLMTRVMAAAKQVTASS